jgi:carbon monoxide dehydrogenase subunit G
MHGINSLLNPPLNANYNLTMLRLVEKIEINAPVEKVFDFIKDIEKRLRLSPAYEVIKVEKLTEGKIRKGTKFRIHLLYEDKEIEYVTEIKKFVENKKIVTKHLDGNLKVTLKLKETPRGTLLIHDEEFVISDEALGIVEEGKTKKPETGSLLQDVAEGIKELAFLIYGHPKKVKRREEIIKKLREDLRIWLGRIKEEIEKGQQTV